MKAPQALMSIAFDLYERYSLLERVGAFFRPERVLDVGGHTPVLWGGFRSLAGTFFPEALTVVADLQAEPGLVNYVRASGGALPFRDESFDFVCSFDTLEHVRPEHRAGFVKELLRVTRDGLYLVFPFTSPANEFAEKTLAGLAASYLNGPTKYLSEHLEIGLPDRGEVASLLSSSGYPVVSFGHGNTDTWLMMMLTYHSVREAGDDLLQELNRRFNLTHAAADWTPPHYRACFLLSKKRGAGDLEALRASLGRQAGKTPDAEPVLALCRLLLEIAQHKQLLSVQEMALANRQKIEAMYHSRVWQTLCAAGKPLLALSAAWRSARWHAGQLLPLRRYNRAGGLQMNCDFPPGTDIATVRGVFEVRGWALDPSGISRVEVAVDGRSPVRAEYGLPRPDISLEFPQYPDAARSGFRLECDALQLSEGPHDVTITVFAGSGRRARANRRLIVDHKTEYHVWIERSESGDRSAAQLESLRYRPKFSILTPVYKTPERLLEKCIGSVLAQTYPDWELCLVDDGSGDPAFSRLLESYAVRDPRILVKTLAANVGIARATNEALSMSSGDYVAFLDHDDELAAFALFEAAAALNAEPQPDVLYSDEDKIDLAGRRYEPFFKPGWSPDLLLSCNYVSHFLVCRRSLVGEAGGLREGFEGSQDYDLVLRLSERTGKFHRIPRVLYHWRAASGSTAWHTSAKPEASAAGLRAITDHLARTSPGATVRETAPCRYHVSYPIQGQPPVTIVIAAGGNLDLLGAGLKDVLKKTSYPNFEILVADNSAGPAVADFVRKLQRSGAPLRYLEHREKPFNYSRINNHAARETGARFLVFLNDDTRVISRDWLTAMLEHAQRKEVGAVGALLLYPDGTIQHSGVTMGLYGNCGHLFKGLQPKPGVRFDLPILTRNCSAVTAACLMLRKEVFCEVGGFDEENLAVAFQDVDLCLKVREKGYRIVCTPHARLYHHEAATKLDSEKIPHPREVNYMRTRWRAVIEDDPYYNPNLTRSAEDYGLRLLPG